MSDIILGIDLGTTNSVVAVADGEKVNVLADEAGNRLIPSVVSFHPEGRILVGEEARERRLIDARNTVYSVKRLIGRPFRSQEVRTAKSRFAFELTESGSGGVVVKVRDETYTLTEISAFVLREVRRVAEARLGQPVSRAVITVPANFNELQRSATKAAGRVAGLEVARIINEPTAAALAYGYGKTRAERVAVYDLGGGTFDLTLLELEADVFEVIGTAGDSFLGGDDVDLIVTDAMAEQFLEQHRYDPRDDPQAFERLRAAAEWAKCQLSIDDSVELTVEELAYGDGGRALDLSFHMTRAGLEERIQPVLGRSFDVCNDALRAAGMRAKDVDSVILVGGSTRIPLVRQMVEQYFGQKARIDIDPDLVVAQGAALHAMALGGARKATKARRSLGRVQLKKMTLSDLRKAQAKRKERQASLPKQPAFAPNTQVENPPPPPEVAGGSRDASAVPKRAVSVGKKKSTLLGLDSPEGADDGEGVTSTAPRPSPRAPGRPRVPTQPGLRNLPVDDDDEEVTGAMVRGAAPPPPRAPMAPPSRAKQPAAPPKRARVATATGTNLGGSAKTPSGSTSLTTNSGLLDLDDPEQPIKLGVSTKPMSPGRRRSSTAQFGTGPQAGDIRPPGQAAAKLPDAPSAGNTLTGLDAPSGPPPATALDTDFDEPTQVFDPETMGWDPNAPDDAPKPAVPRPAGAPPLAALDALTLDDVEIVPPSGGRPRQQTSELDAGDVEVLESLRPGRARQMTADLDAADVEILESLPPGRARQMTADLDAGDVEILESIRPDSKPSAPKPPPPRASAKRTLMGQAPLTPKAAAPPKPAAPPQPAAPPPAAAAVAVIHAPDVQPEPEPLELGEALDVSAPPLAANLGAPAQAQVSTPVLDIRGKEAPLLMDVTPLALGLEMAGGYCQHLIRRNSPIPAEQSRIFTTAADGQQEVEVKICQGDSRVYEENQPLGEVLLSGLRDAPRGAVRIEVTFILDANGTLDVRAVDVDTGQVQRTRINLLGGVSDDEIARMQARQQAAMQQ